MERTDVARAKTEVSAAVAAMGLPVDHVVVLHDSNKLALHLLPCDIFARVAPAAEASAARIEIDLAERLALTSAPVARLEARTKPLVHECGGFAVTFWTHYETAAAPLSPEMFASGLERLHTGMRGIDINTPHYLDRVAEAVDVVENREKSPVLATDDRRLLLDTLRFSTDAIEHSRARHQLLHGEPHLGNVLNTASGPVFIDLETCCTGPVEFDLAHAPAAASERYRSADRALIEECRRLVLAMVGAWRWDVDDQFPDGAGHGRGILAHLRKGPPWPTIGELRPLPDHG